MIDEPAMKRAREAMAQSWDARSQNMARKFRHGVYDDTPELLALAKHLREVSDAVEAYFGPHQMHLDFEPFILPAAKPDPLVEAWMKAWPGDDRAIAEDNVAKLKAHMTEIE